MQDYEASFQIPTSLVFHKLTVAIFSVFVTILEGTLNRAISLANISSINPHLLKRSITFVFAHFAGVFMNLCKILQMYTGF